MLNNEEHKLLMHLFSQLSYFQLKAFSKEVMPILKEMIAKCTEEILEQQSVVQILPRKITCCPHCVSKQFVRHGKMNNGGQRYRCKDCLRTFVEKTGTVFHRNQKNWATILKYIECMLDKRSLRKCASTCKISLATAFVWRHKICDVLRKVQENINLKGEVQSDETYFKVSYKGDRYHYFPEQKKKRGTSKQKVCVAVAVERSEKNPSLAKTVGLGRPSLTQLQHIFTGRIKRRSTLITDSLNSYPNLTRYMGLKHIRIPSGERKIGRFNLNKVNSYHSHLKRFIKLNFVGVASKHLNNYLAYYSFVGFMKDTPSNKLNTLFDSVRNVFCTSFGKDFVNRPVPIIP